jgi:hypothetical protein
MKKIFILLSFLTLTGISNAQDAAAPAAPASAWKKSSQFGINFAGSGFSESWEQTQGGFNNIALGFAFNAKADKAKGKGNWTNDLQLQYGFVRGKFNKTLQTRKSIDRLFFDTKYASKLSKTVNWFVGGNFLTQFTQGVDYNNNNTMISNFLTPGVLSEGVGIEWKPKPFFFVQLGGATLRQTFVNNATVIRNVGDNGKKPVFGVPVGKNSINDMGVNLVAAFDKDVAKNVNLKWRYTGFQVFASPGLNDIDNNPHKALDSRIDATITAKINKYLNVNGTMIYIYDRDIINPITKKEAGGQLTGAFNIGLLYTL